MSGSSFLKSRRSMLQTFLSFFAGASAFTSVAGASQLVLSQSANQPIDSMGMRRFGERAELFYAIEVGLFENFNIIANHHSKKSGASAECLEAMKQHFSEEKRAQILNESKDTFSQLAVAKLTKKEHELLAKIMSLGEDDIGTLMGKIFHARRQVVEDTFKNLDSDLTRWAVGFGGSESSTEKKS